MIDLKELKEIALANVVDPNSEYFYRFICRWYSKTFHTPLHEVFTLPFQDVALAYFEEGYEMMEEEDRFEDMMKAVDPDFDSKEEESIQEFISMIEEEEENKRRAKKEKEKLEGQVQPDKENPNPQTNTPTPPKEVVRVYNEDVPDDKDDGSGFSGGLDDL
jgi:hypothetical protein